MNGNKQRIRKAIFCVIFLWGTLDSYTVVAQSGTDSLIKLPWFFHEDNVYGRLSIQSPLLKRSDFAEGINRAINIGNFREYGLWYFLNSLYADTGKTTYRYADFQRPISKYGWLPHYSRKPNKKDFKILMEFARTYLVQEKEGVDLSEIYESNTYSTISGTAFLSLALNQLEWPYNVKRYNGHLFIVIYGEDPFILDCSKLDKLWKANTKKSDYQEFLVESNCIEAGMGLLELIEQSEEISPVQLLALQKIAEAESLAESDPTAAFYRMEVAYFFDPNPELKKRLIAAAEKVFTSTIPPNDWHKVYAMMNYSRLTGDQSPEFKKEFNDVLKLAFSYYSENEALTNRDPIYMIIAPKEKRFEKLSEQFEKVALKDTMNNMAEINYEKYLGFDVLEQETRGFFHVLNFEQSRERSLKDLEFYVDGLYAFVYYNSSSELLSALYAINVTNYDDYHRFPFMLEKHYQHGALTEEGYHEMNAIFLLSYLDHNAPKNVNEANEISISSLFYDLYLGDLGEHLSFVDNPFLIEKAKAYVERMEPIYRDKFMIDKERLQCIAEICGMTTQLDAFEKMSPEKQVEDLIRRLNLMKVPEE